MCGIAGITVSDKELISRMVSVLRHRGPDDSGIFVDDNVSLGNCRLKVIDLSPRGHQPMANENQTIWMTYNGEVYNAATLRQELEKKGHRFVSDSDTECIIHGYETWGTDVVKKLDGMWGFCIYDSLRQILFLSRDRMGVKPLNYLLSKNTFAFASELKLFAELDTLRRPLSTPGVVEQLMFGFNPSTRTPLDSVFKLRAGENLVFDIRTKKVSLHRYWDNYRGRQGGFSVKRVEKLFDDSINLHLVSDVPVGCFLSGGLDSSIIALKWSEQYTRPLNTFTVGFEGEEDETSQGATVADLIGSNHHELIIGSEDVARVLPALAYYYDLSITDGAFVPNFLISRLAKGYVTVVLAGEGGDEVFGGYPYYQFFSRIQKMLPSKELRKAIAGAGLALLRSGRSSLAEKLQPVTRLSRIAQVRDPEGITRRLYTLNNEGRSAELLYGYLGETPQSIFARPVPIPADVSLLEDGAPANLDYILEIDQRVLLSEKYNHKADRSTTAASLEERVPFQEHNLVEYMNSLPRYLKFNNSREKTILKAIAAARLPSVARRKKRGYGTPIVKWLKETLEDQLLHSIFMLDSAGFLEKTGPLKSWNQLKSGSTSQIQNAYLWNILVLAEGLERYNYLG